MFECSPADHRAGEADEGLVDVGPLVVANSQPLELVQPTDRPLDRPALLAQTAAVGRATTRDPRRDVPARQRYSVGIAVITPIGHHTTRFAKRCADRARSQFI